MSKYFVTREELLLPHREAPPNGDLMPPDDRPLPEFEEHYQQYTASSAKKRRQKFRSWIETANPGSVDDPEEIPPSPRAPTPKESTLSLPQEKSQTSIGSWSGSSTKEDAKKPSTGDGRLFKFLPRRLPLFSLDLRLKKTNKNSTTFHSSSKENSNVNAGNQNKKIVNQSQLSMQTNSLNHYSTNEIKKEEFKNLTPLQSSLKSTSTVTIISKTPLSTTSPYSITNSSSTSNSTLTPPSTTPSNSKIVKPENSQTNIRPLHSILLRRNKPKEEKKLTFKEPLSEKKENQILPSSIPTETKKLQSFQ